MNRKGGRKEAETKEGAEGTGPKMPGKEKEKHGQPGRSCRVEYLPIAVKDVQGIFEYIMKDDPKAARSVIDRFDEAVGRLGQFPEMGPVPRDDRLRMMGYRILIVDNYLVFYVILKDVIEIRRVIHGRRRYSFLL